MCLFGNMGKQCFSKHGPLMKIPLLAWGQHKKWDGANCKWKAGHSFNHHWTGFTEIHLPLRGVRIGDCHSLTRSLRASWGRQVIIRELLIVWDLGVVHERSQPVSSPVKLREMTVATSQSCCETKWVKRLSTASGTYSCISVGMFLVTRGRKPNQEWLTSCIFCSINKQSGGELSTELFSKDRNLIQHLWTSPDLPSQYKIRCHCSDHGLLKELSFEGNRQVSSWET